MAGRASSRRQSRRDTSKETSARSAAGQPLRWWESSWFPACLLTAASLAVYSNNFRHDYFLDDAHVLVNNLSIRSLANIPRFFVDAGTFTSLRANVDYRPVLQATYALNYRMGGYDTWWWHLTQILLHAICAIGIYLLCRRVLRDTPDGKDAGIITWVPLLAALAFVLHPTASGVINYLSARSSLLAAAFLLPSLLLYMVPRDDPKYQRTPWLAPLLFAFALFTKVEAIAALGVYALYEVWQHHLASGHSNGFLTDLRQAISRRTFRRFWPMIVVAAGYIVVRQIVLAPFQLGEARRAADVTAVEYLMTQTVVWWHYVLKWFAPVGLVADYGNYPVYRSLLDGPVLLAIGAWIAVAAVLTANWKTRPHLLFLGLSALALISPTSSIAPLAEMLNEHRPYLPVAVLSLVWIIPLGVAAVRFARTKPDLRVPMVAGITLALLGLGSMTLQRNTAFATDRGYLEDVVAKAPSGRALNNYGLIFMRDGNYQRAQELFEEALTYTPNWHIVHINLGIVNRQLDDVIGAEEHFNRAVESDQFSGDGLTWRASFYLQEGRYADAARDLEVARPRSLEHYRLCKGLATAYAGLGNVARSLEETRRCLGLDPTQTGIDIVAISKPFFDSGELTEEGLSYFEQLSSVIPDTWWVYANISALAGRLGDTAKAASAHARAEELKE